MTGAPPPSATFWCSHLPEREPPAPTTISALVPIFLGRETTWRLYACSPACLDALDPHHPDDVTVLQVGRLIALPDGRVRLAPIPNPGPYHAG